MTLIFKYIYPRAGEFFNFCPYRFFRIFLCLYVRPSGFECHFVILSFGNNNNGLAMTLFFSMTLFLSFFIVMLQTQCIHA